jgi:hypothetical protein
MAVGVERSHFASTRRAGPVSSSKIVKLPDLEENTATRRRSTRPRRRSASSMIAGDRTPARLHHQDQDARSNAPRGSRRGFGTAEIEFAASVAAPPMFAVTACHVVEQCLADTKLPTFVQAMIGDRLGTMVPMHLGDRIIDGHRDLDIATFRITPEELKLAGHTVLTGFQNAWPPRFPRGERWHHLLWLPGSWPARPGFSRDHVRNLLCGVQFDQRERNSHFSPNRARASKTGARRRCHVR